jgi:DNA-binding transcriptional MerR regulator
MAPKQTSLFDFFEEPVEKKQQEKITVPVQEPEAFVVNEDPIEVEFVETVSITETPIIESSIASTIKTSTRGRKKLTDTTIHAGMIDVPEDDVLFQKKYYGIGLVADMFKVNISLIRFWEKEFDILKPKLNGKGDRHFRPEDVKNLKLIHHLLREKKYTIEGAREFLRKNKKSEEVFGVIEDLKKTKLFLTDLKLSL